MKRKYWTIEDINFLKDNYLSKGAEFCANKLDRTITSVQKKASRERIGTPKAWTAEEDTYLRQNYTISNINECAKRLNRSITSIKTRVSEIGLIKKHWTEETYINELKERQIKIKLIGTYLGSKIKTTFKCENGHLWEATPTIILNKKHGCPYCNGPPNISDNPTYLYLIRLTHNNTNYLKIGITIKSDIKNRFGGDWNKFKMIVVKQVLFPTGKQAWIQEQYFKHRYNKYRANREFLKSGNTEVFKDFLEVNKI